MLARRGQREAYLEVLRDFADKTLEGELADEELRRLLVPTDLTEGDGTRPEAVRLLDATSCRLVVERVRTLKKWRASQNTHSGGLTRLRLGSELLTGRLATSRLAGGLLSAGHCNLCVEGRVVVMWLWLWWRRGV